jgi:WD40 repeat protein
MIIKRIVRGVEMGIRAFGILSILLAVTSIYGCGGKEPNPLLPEGNVEKVGEIDVGEDPTCLAISPDGKSLAIAIPGELKIYRMDTLRLSRLIKGVWAYCLSFMGDGSLLVGKDNGTVDLFDPVKWTRVKTFGKHEGIVYAIASSEDGKLVASGGTDGIVYLFDSMLSKRLAEMKHLLGTPVTSLLFSPDGKLLISGGADGKIKLWDLEGREMKAAVAHPGGVVGLFYLPDEDLLISGGMDGSVAIWNPKTLGEIRRVYKGSSSVLHISISYAGKFLALGTSDGKARLIEVGSWNEIASVDLPRPATALALSPDGRRMAVGDGLGSVLIWDTHSIRPDRTISCGSHVSALAFSPDGTLLLSGGDDGGIRVWSCSKWEEIRRSWEHSGRISSLAISPDSRYLASGSWDGTARIWKLQTLEVLYVLKHNAWVSSVSFSQDGLYLATGSGDGTIKVWSVETGKMVRAFKVGTRRSVAAFSPKQKILAGGGDGGRISVWSSTTWSAVKSLDPGVDAAPLSISFSTDGKLLGSGYEDGYIRIWDVGSDALSTSIKAYITPLNNVLISGKYAIASGERNRKVTIWDVSTGELKRIVPGQDWVGALAVSPDGKTLVVGMFNGMANIWSLR